MGLMPLGADALFPCRTLRGHVWSLCPPPHTQSLGRRQTTAGGGCLGARRRREGQSPWALCFVVLPSGARGAVLGVGLVWAGGGVGGWGGGGLTDGNSRVADGGSAVHRPRSVAIRQRPGGGGGVKIRFWKKEPERL